MGKRSLMRLAAVASGGLLALSVAGPAFAAEFQVDLNQSNIFADNPEFDDGFGECTEVPAQDAGEDVWVFVWPGNVQTEEIVDLELNFDTDGDDAADEHFTLADVTPTDDEGTAKLVLVTSAGWKLVNGTSTVDLDDGPPSADHFNLTHSCAGTPKTPPSTTPPGEEESPPPGEEESPPPGEEESPPPGEEEEKPGLPVTGPGLGGLLVLSGGLVAAGVAMVAVRRRRNLSDLLEG